MIPYELQKLIVRAWCKLRRKPVPIDYEDWHDYKARVDKHTSTPEYRERIRNLPPAFTYSRSIGKLTPVDTKRSEP